MHPFKENHFSRSEIVKFVAMENSDFERIKRILDETHDWPAVFLFKFIVPSESDKIARVEALFNSKTAEIRLRESKNGNYTSISAREAMTSAESVLECYKKASEIEGLIAL